VFSVRVMVRIRVSIRVRVRVRIRFRVRVRIMVRVLDLQFRDCNSCIQEVCQLRYGIYEV
jgi:hypothetical protein